MTKEKIREKLMEIQSRIPKEWREKAVEVRDFTPTMKFVIEKGLKGKKLSPEKKAQLQAMYDNGDFSKQVQVENPKYTKLIDQFIAREINKAIRLKQLPPRSKIKDITQ